jgi:pilus assembly protein CpaC
VTERDDANGVNGIPALTTRYVDTAAELQAGQTLALAGLLQHRVEAENRGIPVLADIPWVGAAFRRVEERVNEVELLFLVRPELVDALNPCEVPPCGPGQFTTTPDCCESFGRGYIEVPKCCDDGSCASGVGASPVGMAPVSGYETLSPGISIPADQPGLLPPGAPQIQGANPQGANNRSARNMVTPASAKIAEPGFIGPLGYDVLKK